MCQFGGGQIPELGGGQFGEQLTDFCANEVRSEQLAMGSVGDEFDEAGSFALGLAHSHQTCLPSLNLSGVHQDRLF